ncbi:hypothetical protein [Salibacterium lacus]|uniref:Uncharacterized protein n=1 Tax=Salibacterium lacus TaxID=1898109 RepID=A0ABW5T499_9BACI
MLHVIGAKLSLKHDIIAHEKAAVEGHRHPFAVSFRVYMQMGFARVAGDSDWIAFLHVGKKQ